MIKVTTAKVENIKLDTIRFGGQTVEPNYLMRAQFTSGYMVSLKGYETRYESIDTLDTETISDYQSKAKAHECFIGLWHDSKDDSVYLDLSVRVELYEDARELGIKNKQISIYDIANDKVIYL